ncbi:hypothetical protein N7532_007601 [Penicillium argentinense]|uniref:Uncharacterized protein n=1 Tax=Penicillium argentinense TaxID=1131581 RepID=A0A9W9K755_9EURO|nr:uncharacterized protein N7532_007601 [Penicillium argentinense]KAJ5095310.1 hypothetical protein N7532_007601 [Penicillium argentinense]
MYEQMGSMTDDIPRRCSLPSLKSTTFGTSSSNMGEDRRLPPLPRMEPLPRGPFNPFKAKDAFAPSTPGPQDTFQFKSPWSNGEQIVAPPSPANSAESSWQESFVAQKTTSSEWPNDLSQAEIMSLIAPQKHQPEKHRIAEGNRRQNLSQLHRELDSRIHDFFLERAGWNPSKSLPQSKEHIVQGAVYLIDFMLAIIVHLIRQEQVTPQLSEKLQPQVRCMQLQQLVSNLQQQNQTTQQQLRAAKTENEMLADRNRALEFQLKQYEQMFRSPKTENTSPKPLIDVPEHKRQKKAGLPGLRVFCDEIAAANLSPADVHTPAQSHFGHHDPLSSATSQTFGTSYLNSTPPMTNPSSPAFPPSQSSSFTYSTSRRQSFLASP